jgi:polysaccharide deacetylase family protein (PEP-CTERM system associated)
VNGRIRNVMSVDVEDYFHVEAFASEISFADWHSFAPRVEWNVFRILDLFAKHRVIGTFFILGWVAEKFPQITKEIAAAGHEVGCHAYAHRRLHTMTRTQFQQDLRKATDILAGQVGRRIESFRAPSFSIVRSTLWGLDILAEEGYRFDSSIFPVRHDLYGIPEAARFPHWAEAAEKSPIFEFPPSTLAYGDLNLGVGGGGYLRWMPYGITHWALKHINRREGQPAMVYFHPWEIDPDQPGLRGNLKSTMRHYMNLATMEGKIERLIRDFEFGTLSQACIEHASYAQRPALVPQEAAARAAHA